MKQITVRIMFVLTMLVGYSISYGQSNVATCSKKGTVDCPIVNCPKKGTKDCPFQASFASTSTNTAKAECPLKGTPHCPLIENCPKKGSADCPLIKKESVGNYAATISSVKKKENADLPACCRKEMK